MQSSNYRQCVMTIADLTPNKLGSFEMFTVALSRSLHEKGIHSVVVFNGSVPAHLEHMYEGMTVEAVSLSSGLWNFYRDLYRLIKKYHPMVVHFHFYSFFALINIPIFMIVGRNIIFTDHSSIGPNEKTGLSKVLVRLRNSCMVKFIRKIICVSDYIVHRNMKIVGMDESKLMCLYNGVCLKKFKPSHDRLASRRELQLDDDTFIIVTAVNLIKEKGIDYLLHAAKILTPKYSNMMFLIAGDGTDRQELEMLAKELNIDNKLRFLGMRNNVEQLLTACDVYLYPSIWQEACALGLIEAMACGLPIVATNVGGTPEIVADGVTGIIVSPKDSASIADALEQLYNDNEKCKKMGLNSLERSKTMFDLDRQVREIACIYEEYLV